MRLLLQYGFGFVFSYSAAIDGMGPERKVPLPPNRLLWSTDAENERQQAAQKTRIIMLNSV